MTAATLLLALETRGLDLHVDGPDLVVRPADAVTPEDLEMLKSAKAEVIAILRGRALGVDWSRVSILQLDKVLEVAVPWADIPLLLAAGCRLAWELRDRDPKRGRVWCTCEVLNLLLTGVPSEDARKIAETRLLFDGTMAGVRRECKA
jgi:hypothetical protein